MGAIVSRAWPAPTKWCNMRRPCRNGRSFGEGFVQGFLSEINQITEISYV